MALRHMARVHRVDLDWLIARIRDDPGLDIQYIGTKYQIADILTKATFTQDQWNYLLNLSQVGQSYSDKQMKTTPRSTQTLARL